MVLRRRANSQYEFVGDTMKLLKFGRRRKGDATEDRGYSDIITQALVDAATDSIQDGYVSALETAAGTLSRAFASATVTGAGAAAFDPWVMSQIGRAIVEAGEAVWFRVGQRLRRADNYEFLPSGRYALSLPEGIFQTGEDRVLHVRWALNIASKRGQSALASARTLRLLAQRLENSLATETNASVGYLLPIPSDGDASTVTQLKKDLEDLKGRIAVIETSRGGWDQSAAPRRDFELARLGPDIPRGNVEAFKTARSAVLSACGYAVQLEEDSDGTSQREAWRRYMHGTVSPLGRLVSVEAARIGLPVDIDFEALFASDIQGRARAFQSLVNGGMSLEAAAAASGILTPQEDR